MIKMFVKSVFCEERIEILNRGVTLYTDGAFSVGVVHGDVGSSV